MTDRTVPEISASLSERAEALCRELLPAGRREGQEWRAGNVHGEPGSSLGVHLGGSKAGIWADFASGEAGDLLDLIGAVHQIGPGQAVAWAKSWLGLDGSNGSARARTPWNDSKDVDLYDSKQVDLPDTSNAVYARKIWCSSTAAVDDTEVENYLRGRGIAIDLPPTIRCHAGLKHSGTGLCFPAMVAAVTVWPSRQISAIHRTFLQPAGAGKAQVEHPKQALGPIRNGAVRLSPAAPKIGICEGIEDGLSCVELYGVPTWATLGTANMAAVVLPDFVEHLVIFADADEPGQEAAQKAAETHARRIDRVEIVTATSGKDFNANLQKRRRKAAA